MKAKKIYESPDVISLPNLEYNEYGEDINSYGWCPQFGDADSHPFWLDDDGEVVLGKPITAHPLSIDRTKKTIPGRLWKKSKIISFWVYPTKEQFRKVAQEMSDQLSQFYNEDIDILGDSEWKVEILPPQQKSWKRGKSKKFQSKLVSANEYEGSEQYSKETLGREHIKSPALKKNRIPAGWGSTHPKYMQKTKWRRSSPFESEFIPASIEESISFKRGVDPKESMGIGLEAAKNRIKEEIRWGREDSWRGRDRLIFDPYILANEIWPKAKGVEKIAIEKIIKEWLSGKKGWRDNSKIWHLQDILYELGLLFDPEYAILNPSTWEEIAPRFPNQSRNYALQYFKPNQIYSVGIKSYDSKMMKEGIRRGATNLSIGGSAVFEIPLKDDDGELLQFLLDKSKLSPDDIFGEPSEVARYNKPWMENARDESNRALRIAARDGKINTFKVLFNDPRSNPSATNNFALKWAIKGDHWDIVKILLTDERVREKIDLIPKNAKQKLKDSGLAEKYGLFESYNFERGKDPKKTMKIGKEALKVYRCGHCGQPTEKSGAPISFGSDEFERVTDIMDRMKDQTTEYVICDSCAYIRSRREEDEIQAEYEREVESRQADEQRWREENEY